MIFFGTNTLAAFRLQNGQTRTPQIAAGPFDSLAPVGLLSALRREMDHMA